MDKDKHLERVKEMFKSDEALLDLSTGLNTLPRTEPSPFHEFVPSISASVPSTSTESVTLLPTSEAGRMAYLANFTPELRPPLSYVRSRVIGRSANDHEKNEMSLESTESESSVSESTPATAPATSPTVPDHTDAPHRSSQEASSQPSDEFMQAAFTPLIGLSRFTFLYIRDPELSQFVQKRFFEHGTFWNRPWNLYYVHVPVSISPGPVLFVPTLQAQAFLDQINTALGCNLSLTGPNQEGMAVCLDDISGLDPVFLGQSNSRRDKDNLRALIHPLGVNWQDWTDRFEPDLVREFEDKVKSAVEASKDKPRTEGAKAKGGWKRQQHEKKWESALLRAQSYFGVRPPFTDGTDAYRGEAPQVNVLLASKSPPQGAPVFISVDVELNELNSHQLTEVGISVLDTLDIKNLSPGDYGTNWVHEIRSHHLCVTEHRHIVNHRFCSSCPDKFGFGESESVDLANVGRTVDRFFTAPFLRSNIVIDDEGQVGHESNRTIILVGHALKQDVSSLRATGSQAFVNLGTPTSQVKEQFDTAELYRSLHREPHSRSLGYILGGLNILSANLHNAGNDARYTLEALVRILLEAAGERPGACENS